MTLIRAYKREELEQRLDECSGSGKVRLFTPEEIQTELERRRDLERKQADPRYPELSHS
jgi:hypothetical protein